MGKSKVDILEGKYKQPINDIVLQVIKDCDSWQERADKLGVSKNTLFNWCKQYLRKPPAILVRDLGTNRESLRLRRTKLIDSYPEIKIIFG